MKARPPRRPAWKRALHRALRKRGRRWGADNAARLAEEKAARRTFKYDGHWYQWPEAYYEQFTGWLI